MDKKIKELINKKKVSDEQLITFLNSLESEHQPDSEEVDTSENLSDATDRDTFTKDELNAWIDAKVEAKLKALPKDQPAIIPTFENPTKPKQWKVLK